MSVNEVTVEKQKTTSKAKGMFTKTVVAIFGTILTCFLLLKTPLWGTAILVSFIAGMMGFELAVPTGLVKNKFLQLLSVVFAVIVPWLVYLECDLSTVIICIFVFVAMSFVCAVFGKDGPAFREIIAALTAAFVLPFVMSLLLQISRAENGIRFVLLPFAVAWSCDALAQITGMIFGKHKLIERISPNKTVEGFIGGIGGSVIGVIIYAVVLHFVGIEVRMIPLLFVGAVGALFAVFGDLSLSYIKRECGIKDFGRLLPEHGGILDRFDSVLFVLPLCYVTYPYFIA